MNRRGFTLMELLGIVIILVLIFSLSFPVYLNMIKTNKENKQKSLKKDLCLAGETYLYNSSNNAITTFLRTKTGSVNIFIDDLISADLIDSQSFRDVESTSGYKLTFTFNGDKLNCNYIEG